ncbi:MAG: 50S ribosomal protein L30 [Candidatus Aminicenantes bacterium]|nr:MAG: 50S ribosomal protein L30 [Candidatus Aminicenantes bacterium]
MAVKKSPTGKIQAQASPKLKSPLAKSEGRFIRVKLVCSLIGRPKLQREIVKGLGLRKISSEVVRKDCPEIWGMVNKVKHLVAVEVVEKK